ncbi:CPS_HP_G0129170.mRNA.1.CDS.1 [Saccharomyces cerevisiae]|nr:CPS_HP_G0079330.mRNA.1.CDS.1 [Saccharomyces cerevisiae]CAI5006864.1 CPS_HP_G0081830.mRNA.1.CDS.1 [Saccharomyces cerevisiae]CAI5108504.1 CPS_HP_G0129170.mRNA.1.CDS.1 [Saccharomyces cerevisiae]CAI6919865.1 CPS_HP_G0079330.mRNA.1.CDS.1 [Saccharomyces cerevisiae]CAI6924122.1 CPS_HP_G0081830.mRNA.1.CDS.1 [Saccharomyces cerevisiae]
MYWVLLCGSILLCCLSGASASPAKTKMYGKLPLVLTDACMGVLGEVTWEYSSDDLYSSPACTYEPALQSMLYCIYESLNEKGYSNKTFEKTFAAIKEDCAYYTDNLQNMTNTDFYNMLNNGTTYIVQYSEGSANLTYPIEMDAQVRENYYYSYHGFYANYDIGHTYGGIICAYFVGVMILASILHYLSYTPFKTAFLKQRLVRYVRRYLTLPTIWGKHASSFSYLKIFTGFLPTRSEGVIILGYLVLHTVFLAYGYQYDPYNLIFDSRREQVARYVADRSGVLAFAHFPLIALFAGRNNFLEFISGVKYTSFIMFHKWLGRMMFLDAVIHGAAYTSYSVFYKDWAASKEETYWQFGVAALCIVGVIVFFSLAMFRKFFYEAFLFLHIVLGALFFYTCWEHVVELSGIEWIYAAIAIWTIDRLIRIVRVSYFGFPKASLQLIGDDIIRVTVKRPVRLWKAKPGQYVFVSFLHPLYFWQSHPFTVLDSIIKDGELTIILKEKKGVTRLVKKYVCRNGGKASMRLAIEGPYGSSSPVNNYDNVLLLTGGTGLPGPIAHAIKLGKTSAATGKQFIKLVIAVRGFNVLEAYKPELMCLEDLNVQLHIYNTMEVPALTPNDSLEISQQDEKADGKGAVMATTLEQSPYPLEFDGAVFHHGRPNVEKLLHEVGDLNGSLAVVCCGPPVFVDEVRDQTANLVLEKPAKAIEYFEEYQSW